MKKSFHILLALVILGLSPNYSPMAQGQLANSSVSNGSGAPVGSCTSGSLYTDSGTGNLYPCTGSGWVGPISPSAVGINSGLVLMVVSGSCPSGFAQVTALNGAFPIGTLAANMDVGGTGGSNTITPTVATLTAAAQTFTGNSGTVPAQTFTGTPFSSVINHTHTITSTLTVQGSTTAIVTGTHVMTSTATGGSARAVAAGDSIASSSANPSGGVSSITPAGTNGTVAFTPAGTNGTSSVTGTLNSFDNRPAYVKVIYCQKS